MTDTLERDAELARIAAALDEAAAGEGRVVVIEGQAGAGKTRLVEHARAMAKDRGFGRLRAIGDDLEQAMAWGVVRQMVERSISRYQGDVRDRILAGPAGRALVTLDAAPHALTASDDEVVRTLHALWWVAVDLSESRPLLITVDDAHWADVPSLRFLSYLSRRVADLPIALVVATRPPSHRSGPLVEVTLAQDVERLVPPAFSRAAVRVIAAEGRAEPADEVVAAIHAAAGGNPLLTVALLDEVDARGLRVDDPSTAPEIAALGPRRVTRAVLGRLSAEAVALAGAVAILGGAADLWTAGGIVEIAPATLPSVFDELVAANVLVADDRPAFVHSVLRAAVLADLGNVRAAGLHARAAAALRDGGATDDRIAVHLMAAPPRTLPDAPDILANAAAALLAAGDARAAGAMLARALRERPDDKSLRAGLGTAQLAAGLYRDAQRTLRLAGEATDDRTERARLFAAAATATSRAGGLKAGVAELEGALRDWPDDPSRMPLEARLGVLRSFIPEQRDEALAHLRRFTGLHGETTDERTLLGLLAQRGRYEVWPAAEVADLATRALGNGALFADVAGGTEAMVGWAVAMMALVSADAIDTARAEIARAREQVRRHGSPIDYAMVANATQVLAWRTGDVATMAAESEGVLAAVAAETLSPPVVALRATAVHFGVYGLLERGDTDAARALLDRFDAQHVEVPRVISMVWLRESRARVALALGDPSGAREETRRMREELRSAQIDPPTVGWRTPAALAALRLNEPEEATTLAEDQLRLARRWGAPGDVGAALRLVAQVDPARRLAALAESVEVLGSSPARLERARSLVDLGEALRVAGQRREARDVLNTGLDLAAACGATVLRTRATEALESLGDRPRRAVSGGPEALTASERRVASLAVAGHANRDIARELFVSPKTVENHLGRIYTKLGITGRRQLAHAIGGS